MSTNYTNFLASNVRKYGYTVITYNHICVVNGFVTECKISKVVGGEALTGLGHAPTITQSTEVASRLVADQLSLQKIIVPTKRMDDFQKQELYKRRKARVKRFGTQNYPSTIMNNAYDKPLHPPRKATGTQQQKEKLDQELDEYMNQQAS